MYYGEKVIQVELEALEEFPAELHKFKPASKERLQALAEDISINGILNPIVVREIDNIWPYAYGYQILAGHNRCKAAKMAGLTKVPCANLGEIDDDTALATVISDNLYSRQLLPSERGWAYRQQMEIRSRQGYRSDLYQGADEDNSDAGQNVQKIVGQTSRDAIGEENGKSGRQIQRYIRLTYLIDDLLDMVDSGVIKLGVAVQLSYLSEFTQNEVYWYAYSMKPYVYLTENQVKQIRELEQKQDGLRLHRAYIANLFGDATEEKGRVRFRNLNWPMADLRNHYPEDFPKGISEDATKAKLLEAVRIYKRYTEAVAKGEIEDLFAAE